VSIRKVVLTNITRYGWDINGHSADILSFDPPNTAGPLADYSRSQRTVNRKGLYIISS